MTSKRIERSRHLPLKTVRPGATALTAAWKRSAWRKTCWPAPAVPVSSTLVALLRPRLASFLIDAVMICGPRKYISVLSSGAASPLSATLLLDLLGESNPGP